MKHQLVSRPRPSARKYSSVTYWASLALQALAFYSGFRLALNAEIPPVYRLIAACLFFPVAAVAAVWGGHIALIRRGEKHYHYLQMFDTLPVRIFLGVVLAAIILAVINLTTSF